jgi:CRP-like cAMP-binding protein
MALATANIVRSGERTNLEGRPILNKVLLAISDTEFQAVRPHLEFVHLPHHFTLYEPNRRPDFAYFPNKGMISLVVATADGRTVEVGVVGYEGFSGVAPSFGLRSSSVREVMQITGDGFRIRGSALPGLMKTCTTLQQVLSRSAVLLSMQMAQTAACNRLHSIEQRLARWLLVTQDRVDAGTIRITHDFLATMLGTDRPTVSLAAANLQKRRTLRYTRGSVHILNRKKLERFACECYGAIQQFNGELGLR